jgi:hypothetical protein
MLAPNLVKPGSEQFDRITIWILQLDLTPGRTSLDFVSKRYFGFFQRLHYRREISNSQDDPIPTSRFLLTSIGQRPGTRNCQDRSGKR